MKTWFTEGVDDLRISSKSYHPKILLGYRHGNARGIKTLIGAPIGKTLDDPIEGKLDV
jgi:hypothetical protein